MYTVGAFFRFSGSARQPKRMVPRMGMTVSKKNLRVRRGLYWANQGLIYAVDALGELCQEAGLPRERLRQLRATIEEARAQMNEDMEEWMERDEK